MIKNLTRQDLTDILYGCTILGTGGGGEIQEGMDLIEEALSHGRQFRLIPVDEVPDNALICTPYFLGAVSPVSEQEKQQYDRLPRLAENPIMAAVNRFKAYLGADFYGTISCEMGGANSALSFYVAAMIQGFIVDADPAGRAVPEITHSTYYLNGLPASPIVLVNAFGETAICENIIDDKRAEQLVRSLAVASANDIAAVDHALEMKVLRPAVIKGAVSYALKLGQVLRLARQTQEDSAQAIAGAGSGFVAFRGTIEDFSWKNQEGFTIGDILIRGTGRYAGHTYKINFKNENMISWLDNEVHATIPDLICLMDTDTDEPVTNPNHEKGRAVAVLILPAPKAFLTEKGLKIFGPEYLGYGFKYKPAVKKI
ncbi:DUF917 domain-containing protein [uncultured Desulfobacter sp.]|uniref:DUF917 domain-containing protein n=1 Tax=uncultured Desulfobacter sp. TaxID=240139 RepID=UPI002AABBF6A|nr:DUF917 domain-containing protein [uncultured Desulfobacter sp.]